MCGLAGIAGSGIILPDIFVLRELSYLIGLRGEDSSGIFQGRIVGNRDPKQSDYTVVKNTVDISFFMNFNQKFEGGDKDLFSGINNNVFAVHTRAATKGAITTANAHPFDVGNYIAMHNGTLKDTKYADKDKTDSEMMFRDMNERGVQTVLEELDPDSAYAIVMFDKKTGELIFSSNEDRTLYIAFHKTRAVMYWASEKWMLEGILNRNNISYITGINQFKKGKICKVHPTDVPAGSNAAFDIDKFIPKKKKFEYNGSLGGQRTYGRSGWSDYPAYDTLNTVKQLPKPTKSIVLSNKIMYANCAGCSKQMTPVDQFYGYRVADTTYLCESCNNDQHELDEIVTTSLGN